MRTDEYEEGAKDFTDGKNYKENPYDHGTREWQAWNNGFFDTGDKEFCDALEEEFGL
jgi:hypothetical protein